MFAQALAVVLNLHPQATLVPQAPLHPLVVLHLHRPQAPEKYLQNVLKAIFCLTPNVIPLIY